MGGTTGPRTWEARLLAEWLLEQDVAEKEILELRSGTGLVGILAAKMGTKVLATDGSETVVANLRANFALNNVGGNTEVVLWGEDDDILKCKQGFILGADITYNGDVCSSLAGTYSLAVRSGDSQE